MSDKKTGVELITEERARQTTVKGYTSDHDDEHVHGEIAWAAVCYAAPDHVYRWRTRGGHCDPWPWSLEYDKRPPVSPPVEDRVRALVKAGALIAAEIDRLNRLP
jgi:hypothetical protein